MKLVALFFSLAIACAVGSTFDSNGNPTGAGSVQALHDDAACVDGDTITIPPGPFTWTTAISISKGIHLRGAGAGGIAARSTDSQTIGTGAKTFTVAAAWQTFTPGQTVRAIANNYAGTFPNGIPSPNWMEGTVTSYSAPSLVLNITSVGGSGTFGVWALRIAPATTIIHSGPGGGSTYLVNLNEDATHSVEMSGIAFIDDQTAAASARFLNIVGDGTGRPVIVHDCYFSTLSVVERAIDVKTNRGIIYRCAFDSGFGIDDSMIGFVNTQDASWSTASTMGADDTTGENNFYVEDCYFASVFLQSFDFDGNSRVVLRHNAFDNSGGTSHGSDTGPAGMRHFEIYDNTWYFENQGTKTWPLDYLIYIRGGTGKITDNIMPDVNSGEWGNKSEIKFALFNIRLAPQTPGGCQTVYPAFRQHGQSHNGTTYFTDPIRIWNNTGGLNETPVMNDTTDVCGNGLSTSDFVILDRDYTVGTASPGYTKYTYPHPLRAGSPGIGHTSFSGAGHSTNSGAGTTTIAQ